MTLTNVVTTTFKVLKALFMTNEAINYYTGLYTNLMTAKCKYY